jgi:hypothetical protein
LGSWCMAPNKDDDADILSFIKLEKKLDISDVQKYLVKLGDFSIFTSFLKKIIGTSKSGHNV